MMKTISKLLSIVGFLSWQSVSFAQTEIPDTSNLLDCQFSSISKHPYFPFAPGDRKILVGEEDGQQVSLLWEVLGETREIPLWVLGETVVVRCAIIREVHRVDDELEEISWNYFAQCKSSGSVYYFGEEVDIYEDGKVVSHDGAWLAGDGLNEPGIIMPGTFVPGEIYFQEFAPGQAEDIAENKRIIESFNVPAGFFEGVIEIWEYSPLEPDVEPSIKHYARGLGLLTDAPLVLQSYRSAPSLQITRAIKISWPVDDENAVLEAAPTPEGPWGRVSASVNRINESGEQEAWVVSNASNQFFRLVTP